MPSPQPVLEKYLQMQFSTLTALAVFAGSATAEKRINMTVPVNLSARQSVFDLAVPQTNLEATDFIQNMTQQGRNFTNTVLTGCITTVGTYKSSRTLAMVSICITTPPQRILSSKTSWAP
jgi:hypothetical protein